MIAVLSSGVLACDNEVRFFFGVGFGVEARFFVGLAFAGETAFAVELTFFPILAWIFSNLACCAGVRVFGMVMRHDPDGFD